MRCGILLSQSINLRSFQVQFTLIRHSRDACILVRLRSLSFTVLLVLALSGCDQINETLNKQKSIGKAIGAGCRQSGRSLEDCYQRNAKTAKPDIYDGWKEMSEYMQAKKLDVIPPPPDVQKEETPVEAASAVAASSPASGPATASATSTKPAEKPVAKAPAKH